MTHSKSPIALATVESRLQAQRGEVLEDIRRHLHASGEPDKLALLNHLEQGGDWVSADLLADTDIALLSHELGRLSEIDAALARIASGSYGICIDCGEPIPENRLDALPAAECCVPCKEKQEKQHGVRLGGTL